jgi:hypothetical protein
MQTIDTTTVSAISAASAAFRLNPEQQTAVSAMLSFIADPDPASPFFTLSGFAGTGKTFCLREVVARASNSHTRFAYTAPTNKAAKELRRVTGEASTIYSLLGLRIDKSGEVKKLTTGKASVDLTTYDVIFLDEGWMVNKHLFGILEETCAKYHLKVIFVGDRAQLPPVGEPESPVDRLPTGAALTTVMRHDNQILALATEVRTVMDSIAPCITIKSAHSDGEGVWKLSKPAFKQSVYEAAAAGTFADGSKGKVIAWRNVRVGEYNDLIRSAIFGATAVPGFYLLGDRIVAASPCIRGEDQLLSTDDEALVEGVLECQHPLEPKYKALELKCRTEDNRLVRLLVLHPASKATFENDCQTLAHDARAQPRMWKKFWELKELFHDIKYAYAITAHRSQGSTYENVWVDYGDILLNRSRKEAFQCLYVACTRPTKRLYLA